jgi:hypothetical protein
MMFKSSDNYIKLQLEMVKEEERPATRLVLDLADILTGPTSGGNARHLADKLGQHPRELAIAMKEAAERYLNTATEMEVEEAPVRVCAKTNT